MVAWLGSRSCGIKEGIMCKCVYYWTMSTTRTHTYKLIVSWYTNYLSQNILWIFPVLSTVFLALYLLKHDITTRNCQTKIPPFRLSLPGKMQDDVNQTVFFKTELSFVSRSNRNAIQEEKPSEVTCPRKLRVSKASVKLTIPNPVF